MKVIPASHRLYGMPDNHIHKISGSDLFPDCNKSPDASLFLDPVNSKNSRKEGVMTESNVRSCIFFNRLSSIAFMNRPISVPERTLVLGCGTAQTLRLDNTLTGFLEKTGESSGARAFA